MTDYRRTESFGDDVDHVDDGGDVRRRARNVTDDLRVSLRENGLAATVRGFFSQALERWIHAISQGGSVSVDDVVTLLVGINEFMSFRDSLIVSVVCRIDDIDPLLAMAAHPHDSTSVAMMSGHLSRAFEDPSEKPDEMRCGRAIKILGRMAAFARSDGQAQPRAVISYVMWWMGQDGAREMAESARAADSSCSLASIVISAYDRGVFPAWTSA